MTTDLYIETFVRDGWHRAAVIRTDTGGQVYVTWRYTHRSSARDRARRWIDEQVRRAEREAGEGCLFADR